MYKKTNIEQVVDSDSYYSGVIFLLLFVGVIFDGRGC